VQNITVDGNSINHPNTPWVRAPSLIPLRNLLPNTWHGGAGIELIPVRNLGYIPSGVDVGFRPRPPCTPTTSASRPGSAGCCRRFDQRATRWQMNVSGTLAF